VPIPEYDTCSWSGTTEAVAVNDCRADIEQGDASVIAEYLGVMDSV
jgi:hypothetical protein